MSRKFHDFLSWSINQILSTGHQPHFFDSRLTYHASRSAMVGAMGAGYPLSQNWGYNNYSSYLGYNTGAPTLPGYTQPAISSYPPVIDPILPTATTSSGTTPTSPSGTFLSIDFCRKTAKHVLKGKVQGGRLVLCQQYLITFWVNVPACYQKFS